MTEWIPFNINSCVKLKLSDRGKEIYKSHFEDDSFAIQMLANETDKDGYLKIQLGSAFNIFGYFFSAWNPELPFATDIYFENEIDD